MSQAHIDLGGNRAVVLEPALHSLRLWPAVAGAKLELRLKASVTGESKEPLRLQVGAKLAIGVGPSPSNSSRPLCLLQAQHLIQPSSQATEFTLEGVVTTEQLRAAEQLRQGRQLWLLVSVHLGFLERTAELELAERTGEVSWNIPTSEWAEELERVEEAGFAEVLVPVTGNPKFAKAVTRIVKARTLVRDDQPEQAVGETRKALEQYRKQYKTLQVAQAAAAKPARSRTEEERWAVFVESTFSLLSAAAHDDAGTTELFAWDRAKAITLNATVAGLLGQMAADPDRRS